MIIKTSVLLQRLYTLAADGHVLCQSDQCSIASLLGITAAANICPGAKQVE